MRFNFSVVLVVSFLFIALNVYSTEKNEYYGPDFESSVQSGQIKNQELLNRLHEIIKEKHKSLGYDRARLYLFGEIHLAQLADGTYAVKDVYCEKDFTDADFGGTPNIGPHLIPGNGNILNTEHTWPQSRFGGKFDKDLQKSDLHHLYPSDSEMNSRRGNLRFGYVGKDLENLRCPGNRVGPQSGGNHVSVYEPPVSHRGNVARAIFYFATRYKMQISPDEEAALKEWNKIDPVDDLEKRRNEIIEKYQGNRNPFIDYPELPEHISAFNNSIAK